MLECPDSSHVTLRLAGRTDVAALDITARARHLALHAAQNGPIDSKAEADLEREASLVIRKVVPTDASLTANSTLARRGRFGLFLARAVRPVSLAIRSGPGFVAWYRARRAVGDGE